MTVKLRVPASLCWVVMLFLMVGFPPQRLTWRAAGGSAVNKKEEKSMTFSSKFDILRKVGSGLQKAGPVLVKVGEVAGTVGGFVPGPAGAALSGVGALTGAIEAAKQQGGKAGAGVVVAPAPSVPISIPVPITAPALPQLGGPVAAALVQALISMVMKADTQVPDVDPTTGQSTGQEKKALVLSNIEPFLPLVSVVLAATGVHVQDPAALRAALPGAIDATVAGLNAYVKVVEAIHGPQ